MPEQLPDRMSYQQALDIFKQISENYVGTKKDHLAIALAIKTLQELINQRAACIQVPGHTESGYSQPQKT